jgi:hypothetical protein
MTTKCHNLLAIHSLISSIIFENKRTLNSGSLYSLLIASEKASRSLIGILSSFLVFLDYKTLTALPMNRIFSASEGGK